MYCINRWHQRVAQYIAMYILIKQVYNSQLNRYTEISIQSSDIFQFWKLYRVASFILAWLASSTINYLNAYGNIIYMGKFWCHQFNPTIISSMKIMNKKIKKKTTARLSLTGNYKSWQEQIRTKLAASKHHTTKAFIL